MGFQSPNSKLLSCRLVRWPFPNVSGFHLRDLLFASAFKEKYLVKKEIYQRKQLTASGPIRNAAQGTFPREKEREKEGDFSYKRLSRVYTKKRNFVALLPEIGAGRSFSNDSTRQSVNIHSKRRFIARYFRLSILLTFAFFILTFVIT